MPDNILGKDRYISGEKFYGFYIGEVISVDDPDQWGRVRIRVYEIHGSNTETPDYLLPWAYQSQVFGGCYDSGSRTPYQIGSTVIVIFEAGNPMLPLVLGGICKRPSQDFVYKSPYSNTQPTWSSPVGTSELPIEARMNPTKFVVWKTPKGATLIVEEADGDEFIRLIDRAGQTIELRSPTVNKSGGNPRGVKNSIDSEPLLYPDVIPPSTIKITDLAKQQILLYAEPSKEKIHIKSNARGGMPVQEILLDTSAGQESILIKDAHGQYYKLAAFENKIYMVCLGDNIETVALNRTETIGVTHTKNVGLNLSYTVGGNTSIVTALNTLISTGGTLTINSTGAVAITALATVLATVTAAFTMNLAATLAITVAGVASLVSTNILIGSQNYQKLCNLTFLQLFNAHTHLYNPGPGGPTPTGTPVSPAVEDTHTTKDTKVG